MNNILQFVFAKPRQLNQGVVKNPAETLQHVVARHQYPIMHRIPTVEVWTEAMDDRIRWHNFGPLGPYVAGDRPVFGTQ